MPLSAVSSTSNSSAASARSLPFLMLVQPLPWTVIVECPVSNVPRRPGTDSSSRIRIEHGGHKGHLGVFKHLNRKLSAYRWKVF